MSELRANTISDAAGTGPVTLTGQSAAKAWVNFTGTGTTAINEDYNYSSISDLGTGDYELSFTNSFANATYSTPYGTTTFGILKNTSSFTSSGYNAVLVRTSTGVAQDIDDGFFSNFGDLA